MGRLIEGVWDCNYCKSIGIAGSIRECPHCGMPRDKDIKFYLPQAKKYVPAEQAKEINKNPDWICLYCNALNSDSNTTCKSCGSERTSENLDYFSAKRSKKKATNDSDFLSSNQNEHKVQTQNQNTSLASEPSSDTNYENSSSLSFKNILG